MILTTTYFWIIAINLMLFIVVVTLWSKIDRNFRDLLLFEKGRTADVENTRLLDILKSTNSYPWRLEGEWVHLDPYFFQGTEMRERPLNINVIMRLLPDNERRQLRKALRVGSKGSDLRLHISIPGTTSQRFRLNVTMGNVSMENDQRVCCGIFMVVHDTRQQEQELSHVIEMEEESRVKASFLAAMGHEIRTPLNIIVGFSRMLASEYSTLSDEDRQMYFTNIEQSNEQLLKLMSDVINASTKDGQEPELVLKTRPVSELLEEMYVAHTVVVPDRLRFLFVKGNPDDKVSVNRSSMLQVVSNLMNNAIKFTKEGSISLGWTSEGDDVIIYVEDTGIGIAEENIEGIFTKYVKEHAGSAGAGIGLSLCKRLTEKMHGTIRVKSAVGIGSRFEIVLPRAL